MIEGDQTAIGEEILQIAQRFLDGKIGVIEVSRLLVSVESSLSKDDKILDIMFFVAIDSETDHLPIGSVRAHWDPQRLIEKDKEFEAVEAYYASESREVCSRLIDRFQKK